MSDEQTAVEDTQTETKPEQKVTVEDAGPARKRLTIELPESRILAKIEENYSTLGNDAAIPGFRKGRAPRRLVERRFGSAVRNDVKGQLISEAFSQAIESEGFDVLGEPDVQDIETLELPTSGPFTFVVETEVTPDVTLPDFATLQVEKVKAEVTDQDVTQEVDQMRERLGQMKTVEEGAVQEGDYIDGGVKILAGENAGEDAEVLEHRESVWVLVNGEKQSYKGHVAGIVVADLGKRLAGKSIGETETISQSGPESHENEKIKGQPITIQLTLKQVHRVELAEIDRVLEQTGAESEEKLRERIRENLEGRVKQRQDTEVHRQIAEKLVDLVEMELPTGITGRQTERVLNRRRMELLYQGKSVAEADQEVAELRSNSEDEARKQLKQFFIIDKAAKSFEIEVEDRELNAQVAMMAYQRGRRPEKVRQELAKSGELEQLYLQIREHKTLAKIAEQAQVTEVDAPATSA